MASLLQGRRLAFDLIDQALAEDFFKTNIAGGRKSASTSSIARCYWACKTFMTFRSKETRVLAVDPDTRGFGFAVLEGLERLIDWGVKETRTDKNRRSLKLVADLIDRYEAAVIVLEDYTEARGARCGSLR